MRGSISAKVAAVWMIVFWILERWIDLPNWLLFIPIALFAVEFLAFCYALYQRQKELERGELEEAKQLDDSDTAPVRRSGSLWGKLWLLAVILLILSPVLFTTHPVFLVLILLCGLPVLLPMMFGTAFLFALDERRKEKQKGEANDAKNY